MADITDNLELVKKYKNFLLAQFASECYLNGLDQNKLTIEANTIDVESGYADPKTLVGLLALGANSSDYYRIDKEGTQFKIGQEEPTTETYSATLQTQVMITQFNEEWKVIDQLANTASGFSATLLQNRITDKYHLSFRSTESKSYKEGGDVERDSSAGANGEIFNEGFAWAQIMDMETYYQGLCEGKLAVIDGGVNPDVRDAFQNNGTNITVTGYSLGSHLAQVFTLMHEEKIDHTYIFNGAGMGKINGVDYNDYGPLLLDVVNELRADLQFAGVDTDIYTNGKSLDEGAGNSIYDDSQYEAIKWAVLQELKMATTASFSVGLGELLGLASEQIETNDKITNLYGHGDTDDMNFTAGQG